MLAIALWLAWSPAPPTTSLATRGTIQLEWSASADVCPDADAVIDDALALVGEVPPGVPELRVVATVIAREPSGFALTLRIGEGADAPERHLEAAGCDEVARAAALLTAMAIDPTMVGRMPEDTAPEDLPLPDPEPEPPTVTEPVVPPRPITTPAIIPTRPRPVTRRKRELHASAMVGAGVGVFALPRPTADLELGLALTIDRARIEIAGSWWSPVRRTSPSNPAIVARLQLGAAVARACWVPRWRTIEIPLCGAFHAGVMAGRGTAGLETPLSARAAWLAVGGGPMLMWRPRRLAGRLGLWVRTEGLAALAKPAFATAPSGRVLWRAESGALSALAGVEVRFWSSR